MLTKKMYTVYASGGLAEAFDYGLRHIKKFIWYKSETVYLYLERAKYENKSKVREESLEFRIIKTVQEIKELDFARLKLLPYEDWIGDESEAIVGYFNGTPISYSWLHYRVAPDQSINLKPGQCWTGPSFVHKKRRKKGINSAQKAFLIEKADKKSTCFVTSVNKNNVPSIKTNLGAGFQKGAIVTKHFGWLARKQTQIIFCNSGASLLEFK